MQENRRPEEPNNNNNVKSGWERILPSTGYESPLEELGIIRDGMTGREVYEASKAYWKAHYANRTKRKAVYRTLPWVNGCKCQGAGWYMLDVDPADYRYGVLQRCDCNANRSGQNFRASLQAFADDTFETFDLNRPTEAYKSGTYTITAEFQQQRLRKAYDTLCGDEYSNGISYYVWGNVGCGKSHLARAWAIRYADMGYSVRYRMMPALVDELRSSVKNGNTEAIIDSLINADILVLDDIGSEDDHTEWIRGRMLRIIDARMNKKTLYTSNLDTVDLFNKLDERIADRINQSQRLWLPLQSYRQLIREKGRGK